MIQVYSVCLVVECNKSSREVGTSDSDSNNNND